MPRDRAAEAGPWIAAMATRGRIAQRQPPEAVKAFSRREIARRFAAVLDATQTSGSAGEPGKAALQPGRRSA